MILNFLEKFKESSKISDCAGRAKFTSFEVGKVGDMFARTNIYLFIYLVNMLSLDSFIIVFVYFTVFKWLEILPY